jgi:hypothetical protein
MAVEDRTGTGGPLVESKDSFHGSQEALSDRNGCESDRTMVPDLGSLMGADPKGQMESSALVFSSRTENRVGGLYSILLAWPMTNLSEA